MKEAGVEAEQSNRGGGGASPLQEERLQQACVICGMLGCCIPGTFFSQALFLQRCKVTGELTAEEMLSAWGCAEVNDTFCQALFLKI